MLPRFASSGSALGLPVPSRLWAQAPAIRLTASRRPPTTVRLVRTLMGFSLPLPLDVNESHPRPRAPPTQAVQTCPASSEHPHEPDRIPDARSPRAAHP